jgi:periplasmic protein CpxP/Spy
VAMTMKLNAKAAAGFVLVAVFSGGLLAGVLVERALLAPPSAEASAGASAAAPKHRPGSAEDRDRIARELELTPDQRAQIDLILDEQQARMRAILTETRPQTRAVVRETRARIEEVLTPEQRARLEELHVASHRSERGARQR